MWSIHVLHIISPQKRTALINIAHGRLLDINLQTSSQNASVWGTVDVVVCVVVPYTSPGNARLVGPFPPRPVMDGTPGQQVVAAGKGELGKGRRSNRRLSHIYNPVNPLLTIGDSLTLYNL